MRSAIEINRAKKEWKVKYKELLCDEHEYRYALNDLRTAPLNNEILGRREALRELIDSK